MGEQRFEDLREAAIAAHRRLGTTNAKRPEFGLDYAATHRVEGIAEGGLLVHLNDNCVLVLFPLPLAGCVNGKRKANEDLFEHMHDGSQAGRND
jgi:hypothetical protein